MSARTRQDVPGCPHSVLSVIARPNTAGRRAGTWPASTATATSISTESAIVGAPVGDNPNNTNRRYRLNARKAWLLRAKLERVFVERIPYKGTHIAVPGSRASEADPQTDRSEYPGACGSASQESGRLVPKTERRSNSLAGDPSVEYTAHRNPIRC